MLTYDRVLFQSIGNRVRHLRDNVGGQAISLAQLVVKVQLISNGKWTIDQHTLSKVERGLTGRNNRYLLSANQIQCLADVFGITSKELVWGDETERENLVRLMLIAIIADRAKTNPFIYYDGDTELPEFFAWAKKQKCLGDDLREITVCAEQMVRELPKTGMVTRGMRLRDGTSVTIGDAYERLSAFFTERYGWFYSAGNKHLYNLLHSDTIDSDDDRVERQHNLADAALANMMADLHFAKAFCDRLSNLARNTGFMSDYVTDTVIDDIREDKGRFADIAMDYGEYDYCLFVDAFRRFWGRHGEAIMGAIDKDIFNGNKLMANGLKAAVKGIDGYEPSIIKAIKNGEDNQEYGIDKALGVNYYDQTLQAIKAFRLANAHDDTQYSDFLEYAVTSRTLTASNINKRMRDG